jgi:hypothetical protein
MPGMFSLMTLASYWNRETNALFNSTPTEWATFAWESASKSALLVRHGDDHTTFNRKNSDSPSKFLR